MDDEVSRKLDALWSAAADRARARAELERYGVEAYEREQARVQLAILKVCAGRLEQLAELVALAKRDYRDLLMFAEYPGEAQAPWAVRPELSPEERARLARLRAEDRQQYLRWRKG